MCSFVMILYFLGIEVEQVHIGLKGWTEWFNLLMQELGNNV